MNEWNDIAVLVPVRDIDIASVPLLREQVDGLIDMGMRRIIINCQNVAFIDSTGLAFLLACARRLARGEGLLSLVNASANVIRFIQIARLIDVLHVRSAQKTALPVLSAGVLPKWNKTISVTGGIECLGAYRHRVSELLATLPMTADARFDTALAAGEALSNAFDHAGGVGCSMTVQAYHDRVVIEVRDGGAGFELSADQEIEASEERGRGIKLMRMLVDSVDVSRRRDVPGTCVRLVKLIGAAAA